MLRFSSRRGFMTCLGTALAFTTASHAATRTESRAAMPASRPQRGYAPGPHGLVHFHDTAARAASAPAAVPLVLLHQSPSSALQFEAGFEPLAERGLRNIAMDTPGFGNSDPTAFVPRVEDWASSVVAVLDHLGIEQADILGHHTGSCLATEVAIQFPKRVRRVILNGPFVATEAERATFMEGMHRTDPDYVIKKDGSHLMKSFDIRMRMGGVDPDPKVATKGVVAKYQALGPFTWGHNAAFRYDHAATMRQMKTRTLILTNTGDDIYTLAKRAREMFPNFEYAELIGGSHDIVDQQPEEWAEAVAAFLVADKSQRS